MRWSEDLQCLGLARGSKISLGGRDDLGCQQDRAHHGGYGHEPVARRDQVKDNVDTDRCTKDDCDNKKPSEMGLPPGPHQETKALCSVIPSGEHRRGAQDERHKAQQDKPDAVHFGPEGVGRQGNSRKISWRLPLSSQ